MAFGILSVFGLFFPAIIFVFGAFLFYRGMEWRKGSFSGPATSRSSFRSLASGTQCIYQRIVVEYRDRGYNPWKTAIDVDMRPSFLVGKKPFDTAKAVFEIKGGNVFKGYAGAKFRGMIGGFLHEASKSAPVELGMEVLDAAGLSDPESFVSRDQYLDDDLVSKLLELRGGDKLKRHIGRALRVSEYVIPVGTEVYISGADTSEVVVSDSGAADAESSLREKSIMRAAAGLGLVALSLILSVLILLS